MWKTRVLISSDAGAAHIEAAEGRPECVYSKKALGMWEGAHRRV